jgi:hypothetical protein
VIGAKGFDAEHAILRTAISEQVGSSKAAAPHWGDREYRGEHQQVEVCVFDAESLSFVSVTQQFNTTSSMGA